MCPNQEIIWKDENFLACNLTLSHRYIIPNIILLNAIFTTMYLQCFRPHTCKMMNIYPNTTRRVLLSSFHRSEMKAQRWKWFDGGHINGRYWNLVSNPRHTGCNAHLLSLTQHDKEKLKTQKLNISTCLCWLSSYLQNLDSSHLDIQLFSHVFLLFVSQVDHGLLIIAATDKADW